jgi:hypothetical protein|tara:strand:+ start:1106 stop:1687 length:582 start_codon:yes stop_codon:yes gene_type:complete
MNNDLTNLMEQDFEQNLASSVEKIDDGGLSTVASLARQIRNEEQSIAELDRQLKEKKKSLLKLTDEDLPSVLAEMGISSFSLDDGSTVDVKNTYGASILVDNRPKAYDWLRENGYDDIIKNTVSSTFGRGEDDRANAFSAFAQKEGYDVNQKTEIHPQTLRAFVKERCEAGDEFPMDLFGAYIGQRAVIKGSK